MLKFFLTIIFSFLSLITISYSDTLKDIVVDGNDRVSDETVKMFSSVSPGDEISSQLLNNILNNLYDTNFFKDVSVSIKDNVLKISVKENPLIESINYMGLKSEKLKSKLTQNLKLKSRSSYNELILNKDKDQILTSLKELGYHFSTVDVFIKNLNDNKVKIDYEIFLGNKAKIKKITFVGDKVFKDNELKRIIISEEYKFWKFVSGKKYLNSNIVEFDKKLLKNFYLNNGYYDVTINSSFAKLINDENFELVFNINAKNKFFFGDIKLQTPINFDKDNFKNLFVLFNKLKGEPYSLNSVDDILEEIDQISVTEQFESISASVSENISSDKINLTFIIQEIDKFTIERVNIYGNNVTRENVIRNQLVIDEGDIYNEILEKKSENNLKSLNFFKNVKLESKDGDQQGSKIIDIYIEEKPTGEISAGAGFGTSGGSITAGIKENNYLGKGLALNTNLTISNDSLQGLFSVNNPNFNNSNKSLYATIEASEFDRLTLSGYKNNKTGFVYGTDFEYLDDLFVGLGNSNYYEKIETNSNASETQKKQEGDYWDSFLKFNLFYDKRNQKFKTSKGFFNSYKSNVPLISESNTFTNSFETKYFTELYEGNISTFSIFLKSAKSITNDNIKLSERLFVPSKKLRGFERGKIGPIDGSTYVGGNYLTSLNFTSTLPYLLENSESLDLLFFIDAVNLWGVDYNTSLDNKDNINSSLGIGIDYFSPIGPLSFSFAQPLTKNSSDITETFRFNIGTSF
jgi:outer membrane protein insertion porin family